MKPPIIIALAQTAVSIACIIWAAIQHSVTVTGYILFAITTVIYAWAFAIAMSAVRNWREAAERWRKAANQ